MTFGDILKNVRMKKACTMLREGNATVESIAETVGYQNVEHFNRIFKKMYQVTPVQFRNQKDIFPKSGNMSFFKKIRKK